MRPGLSEWWRKYGLRMLSMVVLLFRMVECESSIVAIVEWLQNRVSVIQEKEK